MLLPIFLHEEEHGYEARLLARIQRLDVIYFTVWDRSSRKSRDLSIGGASPGLQSFTALFLLTGKTDVTASKLSTSLQHCIHFSRINCSV